MRARGGGAVRNLAAEVWAWVGTVAGALALAAALSLAAAPAWADVAVAGRPAPDRSPGPGSVCPLLIADQVSVRSATEIEWSARIVVEGGAARVSRSRLVVRDAAGRSVFEDGRAFIGPDQADGGVSVGLGMSSNAGPTLPELPAGRYAAVWTVDGVASNVARFAVGAAQTTSVVLEALSGPACARGLLAAHVYNPGPKTVDLLEGFEGSSLIVDGRRFVRQGVEWDGGTALPPGRAWGFTFKPGEYAVPPRPGKHRWALEFGAGRSPPIELDLR